MTTASLPRVSPPPVPDQRDLPGPHLLHFAAGLPGFPACRVFEVVALPEELQPFALLRSMDSPGVEFVVVPPGCLFSDYDIEVDEDASSRLGLGTAADGVVLVIVALGATVTVNLLGPLVVHRDTGSAAQVVQRRPYGASVPVPVAPPAPVSAEG